jgi:hypothetical protein
MPTYLDEKRRRISQFAEHLRLMGLRAHKLAKGSCLTILFGSIIAQASGDAKQGGARG